MDRSSAFREVQKHFPEFLNLVPTCYRHHAELIFGDVIIQSQTGFHQGDPLASLLFSLTLQPIVDMINEEIPHLLANEWYLDDGAVVGAVMLYHVVMRVKELPDMIIFATLYLTHVARLAWDPLKRFEISLQALMPDQLISSFPTGQKVRIRR